MKIVQFLLETSRLKEKGSVQMIERNAPCPCGSGKTYKNCCAINETFSQTNLVQEELENVLIQYLDNSFEMIARQQREIEKLNRKWHEALGRNLNEEVLEQIVFDYFLFIRHQKQWTDHIIRVLNRPIRTRTKETLMQWKHPFLLVGKVIAEDDEVIQVEEVVGHKTFNLPKEVFNQNVKNDVVIGFVVSDPTHFDNGLFSLGEMYSVSDPQHEIMKTIQQFAEQSDAQSLNEFYERYIIDVYRIVFENLDASESDFSEAELSSNQLKVLDEFEKAMNQARHEDETIELGKAVLINYFTEQNPTFRQPRTIAAAAMYVIDQYDFLGYDPTFSQKEIADLFGVSISSMRKYIEPLEEVLQELTDDLLDEFDFLDDEDFSFLEEDDDLFLEEDEEFGYFIGTDPGMTERFEWELFLKILDQPVDSLEEAELLMSAHLAEPFTPRGKDQIAQDLAYQAYATIDFEERERLATRAYKTDPLNIDAIILKTEQVESVTEKHALLEKAIRIGSLTFDDGQGEISPWELVMNRPYLRAILAYGTILFEMGQYEEALPKFEQLMALNPGDEQNVRHLLIATLIHLGELEKAHHFLKQHPAGEYDHALYEVFEDILHGKENGVQDIVDQLLADDDDIELIKNADLLPVPYPKEVFVTPYSAEEAFYTAFLLAYKG